MSGPSQYVRQAREEGARRRLEIAKALREDPTTTNIQLAEKLNVSRNTITIDRRALMEELKNKALGETEVMRFEMVQRLERLDVELEKHRKKGKLPVGVLHEMHLVTRSIIELLGVRKPVTEKLEVRRRAISFEVQTVRTADGKPVEEPKIFEIKEPLTLEAGKQ